MFEVVCDTRKNVLGEVLGERIEKLFNPIYYASKILNDAKKTRTLSSKNYWWWYMLWRGFVPTF